METYLQQKQRHQKELGEFEGIFFAFNTQQFNEGMIKIGLNPEETDKIYSLGAGGYIRKDKDGEFCHMLKRHDEEIKTLMKDRNGMIEALVYELRNHEYCITYDPREALEALGLSEQDVNKRILKEAISLAL